MPTRARARPSRRGGLSRGESTEARVWRSRRSRISCSCTNLASIDTSGKANGSPSKRSSRTIPPPRLSRSIGSWPRCSIRVGTPDGRDRLGGGRSGGRHRVSGRPRGDASDRERPGRRPRRRGHGSQRLPGLVRARDQRPDRALGPTRHPFGTKSTRTCAPAVATVPAGSPPTTPPPTRGRETPRLGASARGRFYAMRR